MVKEPRTIMYMKMVEEHRTTMHMKMVEEHRTIELQCVWKC